MIRVQKLATGEYFRRSGHVGGSDFALGIPSRKIIHGVGIPLGSGPAQPKETFLDIFFQALPTLQGPKKSQLRHDVILVRGLFEVMSGHPLIRRRKHSAGVLGPQLVLSLHIAGIGGSSELPGGRQNFGDVRIYLGQCLRR